MIPLWWSGNDLRVYPPAFAATMGNLVEEMNATSRGQPQINGQIPHAVDTMKLEWESDPELWQFVDFQEIFVYLRGSTRLSLPDIWKSVIPRKLPK